MSYLKVKEVFIDDTGKIEVDKLNYSFNLLQYGGPIGPSGVQGLNGSLGAQGIQGIIGATGATGLSGVPGTSNTHWDSDENIQIVEGVFPSFGTTPIGNILRPLYNSFSSRIILGDNNTDVYTNPGSDPSYEPQAFISFLTNNSGLSGEENAIEFKYRTFDIQTSVYDYSWNAYLLGMEHIPGNPTNLKIFSDSNNGTFTINDMNQGFFVESSLIDFNAQQDIILESLIQTKINSNFIQIRSEQDMQIKGRQIDIETSANNQDITFELFAHVNPLPSGQITFRTSPSDIILKTANQKKIQLQNINGGTTFGSIELYGRGANLDFMSNTTNTIDAASTNSISSNYKVSLGHGTSLFTGYNNTDKFFTEGLINTSTQDIFFSDSDGNHDGSIDNDAIMSNNSMTTGDGVRWIEGPDEDDTDPANVIYAAPNFGSTERERTLSDYYVFDNENVQAGFLRIDHNSSYPVNKSVYGVDGDIISLDAEYVDLPNISTPLNFNKLSYTKIGDSVKVDGRVRHTISGSGLGNETIGWDDVSSTNEQLAIRIASPEIFPYVNSAPFPIDVDITIGKIGQLSPNYLGQYPSINQPLGGNDSSIYREFDNINIKGVILPGDNKILLYGSLSKIETSALVTGYFNSIEKRPITPEAIANYILSIVSWGITVQDLPSFIEIGYSFEMPTDWNSYNRLKTNYIFSVNNGSTTYTEDGECSASIPVNFNGPVGSNWSYFAVCLGTDQNGNIQEQPTLTLDTYIDALSLQKTANSLQFQTKSISGTNVRFYFTHSYTGEVKTCDLTISSALCGGGGGGAQTLANENENEGGEVQDGQF